MWKRTSGKGMEFWAGNVELPSGEVMEIIVFTNDKGDNPKRPDFRIYPSTPKQDLNPNGTEKVTPSDGVPF